MIMLNYSWVNNVNGWRVFYRIKFYTRIDVTYTHKHTRSHAMQHLALYIIGHITFFM